MVVDLKKNPGQPKGTKDSDKTASLDNIADLDFSDIQDEKVRELVKAKTALKAKQLLAGTTKKFTELKAERDKLDIDKEELGELKKIRDEFSGDPKLAKAIEKVYFDHKSGKLTEPAVAKKHLKKIDELIAGASTLEDRQSLEDLKVIIDEETGGNQESVSDLKRTVERLENQIKVLSSTSQVGLTEKISRDIGSLKKRFGDEIVDKYEKELRGFAIKYPKQTMDKIFYQLADDVDIKQALLNEAKIEEKKDTDNRKGGFEPAGDGVITDDDKPRDAGGRVILGGPDGFIARILKKRNLKIK